MIHQVTWSDRLGRHTATIDGPTSRDAAIKIAHALRSGDNTCNSTVMQVDHNKKGTVFIRVYPKPPILDMQAAYPEPMVPALPLDGAVVSGI